MRIGFSKARVLAIVFLTVGAVAALSCAREATKTDGTKMVKFPKEHVVLLTLGPSGSHFRALATPDHLVVSGYKTNSQSVVIWSYHHKSTKITFKPSTPAIPDATCDDAVQQCTLTLPQGLSYDTQYKYTITGKDNNGNDLDPNDPDLEVDR
jgi:hypothetical protein